MELNQIYNEDCIEGMKRIPDASIDVILTDPPYKYLPEDFDRDFDEGAFFKEADRVLKPDGWIILFGRGTSFYRWNTRLAEIGYHLKEEIIWDKCYNSSPTAVLQRFHETISVHCKGTASIRKCRVPYMEKRVPDTDKIISDIKRLSAILHNPTELASVEGYLRTGNLEYHDTNRPMGITVQATLPSPSRCASVARSMKEGLLEASIIKIRRDHYNTIHPTQKPVRLLERLLNLVIPEQTGIILDPFSGSGSTALACKNTGRDFIGFEIDQKYWAAAVERLQKKEK